MTQLIDLTNRKNMFYWQMDRQISLKQIDEIFLQRHDRFDSQITESMIIHGMRISNKSKLPLTILKLTKPIDSGSVNLVSKATLSDGTKIVIRVHPKEVKNGYFWAESIASQIAKDAGVPTFSTFFVDDSRHTFPYDFMIIEQLPGNTMQDLWPIQPDLDRSLIEETGKYLARIHSVQTAGYGFFDNTIARKESRLQGIHTKWKEHVFAGFIDNLNYLSTNQVITIKDRQRIEAIISKYESYIECSDPRLIQNDLADWNQLVNTNHISGIIDWDECFSGDPVCDFSTWSVFFTFERMEHLKRGYQMISPLPNGFEEKLHIYRIRYIVSKLVGRKKRLLHKKSTFIQKLYTYALKILVDEFKWFGV